MNKNRIRLLQTGIDKKGAVVYWMSRDQRLYDNWAFTFAQELSLERVAPLAIVFCLQNNFLGATIRQYGFMLRGLHELELEAAKYNIPFQMLIGSPENVIPQFINEIDAGVLISDFDPLKIKRVWKRDTAKKIKIPFYEVDAHNVVPCLYASNKEEFAAYTIRPKINKLLPEFLDEFPKPEAAKNNTDLQLYENDWDKIWGSLTVDNSVKEVDWIKPGETAAVETLADFLQNKLLKYNEVRNDPTLNGQSNLSPYLHFGQLSAQRIALNTLKYFPSEQSESFLEELIVRRELADNFCYYNTLYDSFLGFKDWAKLTLNTHRADKREFTYSLEEFENAAAHEELWNAAQNELVNKGKMHGYMRMYWAKKILEWSQSPEEALRIAIYLNDKYSLDGRDPNGYTGCAWSIGGIHDRAWGERSVFGKIRYMNFNGCKRKFDVEEYIRQNKKKH